MAFKGAVGFPVKREVDLSGNFEPNSEAAKKETAAVEDIVSRARTDRSTILIISQFAHITRVPETLGSCTKVVHLRIDNNFNLSELPDAVSYLSNLEHLDLSYNALRAFPTGVTRLRSLRYLNVSNNKLLTIDREIDALKALEIFLIDNNYITSFPPAIGCLRHLKEFSVANNPLVEEDESAEPSNVLQTISPDDPMAEPDCTICQGSFEDNKGIIVYNYIDIVDVKNVPCRYTVCSARCKALVEELRESEIVNYNTLIYN